MMLAGGFCTGGRRISGRECTVCRRGKRKVLTGLFPDGLFARVG